MSINDYAAYQGRRHVQAGAELAVQVNSYSIEQPRERIVKVDEMKIEESALTDTFIGKLKKFWSGT